MKELSRVLWRLCLRRSKAWSTVLIQNEAVVVSFVRSFFISFIKMREMDSANMIEV